jgi:ATP-binding cassette subfamily F protein 3
MLTAHHLTKSYGIHTILQDISFSVSSGDRAGLIGPNGCGKTTLLRILIGQETPDQGSVVLTRPGLRVGYLSQGFELEPGQTLAEAVDQARGRVTELEDELERLATALAQNPTDARLQSAYDDAIQSLQLSTYNLPPQAVLAALGLDDVPNDQPVGLLSGGQKTRLSLALVLLGEPHLLLLDEPTNNLDIQMLEWLESWLKGFRGSALIVSHDRAFLDNTVKSILELHPLTHGLKQYTGNYSDYLEQKQAEQERQLQAYLDQQVKMRHMQQDITRLKAQAAHTERQASSIRIGGPDYKLKGFKSYQQGIAKKVAKKAKARQKKLERYLESDERVEKPRQSWQIKLDFGTPNHLGKDVLHVEEVTLGYPGQPVLLENVTLHIRAGQRIVLTGPNGCGKTTLLRAIVSAYSRATGGVFSGANSNHLEPLKGSIRLGSSVRLGYMTQEQELLEPERSALEIIQHVAPFNETETRSFLHYFLFNSDNPLRPLRELSFGERSRLELAVLVAQGCNFLILDEPINHLDIPSRSHFEQALMQFGGAVLAVVHDRYFIERFASEVWVMEGRGIRIV